MRFSPNQVVGWVRRHFKNNKMAANGQYIIIESPFSDSDKLKFNIKIDGSLCHDWRGDAWAGRRNVMTGKQNRTFLNFVRTYLKCTIREAIESIQSCSAGVPEYEEPQQEEEQTATDIKLPPGSLPLWDSPNKLAASLVLNWLASRGIDFELVKKYQIHHQSTDAVWPYYEYGEFVYWQSRAMTSKIFSFPSEKEHGVSKTMFLYNFDDINHNDDVVIVEAIFGAMTIDQQTVATGGACMSPLQMRKLKLLNPKRVILAADYDDAGIKSVIENSTMLMAEGYNVYYSLPIRQEYAPHEFTNDWNDMRRYLKMSVSDIRKHLWDSVVKISPLSKFKLMGMLK